MSDPNEQESMRKLKEMFRLGATGEFPEGKLVDRDEGEIKLAIAAAPNKVLMNFGTPVAWIGFTPEQAKSIGELLIEKSKESQAK